MAEEQNVNNAPPPTTQPLLSNKRLESLIRRAHIYTDELFTQSVSISEIHQLCDTATNVLQRQPTLLELQAPLVICGDVHGQYKDLKKILTTIGYPPYKRYLFLGDIVDRGEQNLETAVLLLSFKARYPDDVFLLRGNHECTKTNQRYGFLDEIQKRYGERDAQEVWMLFNNTFAWLPYTALIGNRILCLHGGLTPSVDSLLCLRNLRRPMLDPPKPSLELDILWSDPYAGLHGTYPSPRKAGVLFGEDVVHNACRLLGIDLIVRANSCVPNGSQYFANQKMITIFSAPRYEDGNEAATLTIDENLKHSIQTFP